MTLTPTEITIQGKRVWLQDADPANVKYVDYHVSCGLGLHTQFNTKLPKAESIEVSNGTAERQQKQNQ